MRSVAFEHKSCFVYSDNKVFYAFKCMRLLTRPAQASHILHMGHVLTIDSYSFLAHTQASALASTPNIIPAHLSPAWRQARVVDTCSHFPSNTLYPSTTSRSRLFHFDHPFQTLLSFVTHFSATWSLIAVIIDHSSKMSDGWGSTAPTEGGQQTANSEPWGITEQGTDGNDWGTAPDSEADKAKPDADTAVNPSLRFEALTLGKDEFRKRACAASWTETTAFNYAEFQCRNNADWYGAAALRMERRVW